VPVRKLPPAPGFTVELESQLMSDNWIDHAFSMQKRARGTGRKMMNFGSGDMN